jgi:hypothetical protein
MSQQEGGQPGIPTTIIGKESTAPFPIFDRIWDIFAGKGIRTVFFSIGASSSGAADLELAESIGCPIHIVAFNDAERAKWEEVIEVLKEKKREGMNATHDFSKGAEARWVLPKNVRIQPALPWWSKGTIDLSGSSIATDHVQAVVRPACSAMKIKDGDRIDILKIDVTDCAGAAGLERGILQAVLDAGYRPAVVLVHWSDKPDVILSTTLAAGHLQNCGYKLVSKLDNKFLYYYNDEDMYQICSWENTAVNNPMVQELLQTARISFANMKAKKEEKDKVEGSE